MKDHLSLFAPNLNHLQREASFSRWSLHEALPFFSFSSFHITLALVSESYRHLFLKEEVCKTLQVRGETRTPYPILSLFISLFFSQYIYHESK